MKAVKMKSVLLAVAAMVASVASAAPTITVDSVVQRWPWNNKIDITYTVGDGQDVSIGAYRRIVFTTVIDGTPYTINGVSDLGASANTGTHTVTWTLPDGVKSDGCTMSAAIYAATDPSGDDYMVIDLATGAVSYEGLLATQDDSNARYTNAVYKTDKLVLRKVPRWANRASLPNAASLPANGYPTGDDVNNSSDNRAKTWNTTRDYYVGIFPVTQAQYKNVGLSNPSTKTAEFSGNTVLHRPVETISWDTLRVAGTAPTSPIPIVQSKTGTFFQRLNYITGNKFGFDIPTEVMFEIAARAGATTTYYWGSAPDMRYVIAKEDPLTNDGNYTVAVGLKLPNNWGLFDTQGNVLEWCLDDFTSGDNMGGRNDVFTPNWRPEQTVGRRRLRGAGPYRLAYDNAVFRSSYRSNNEPTTATSAGTSFRVCMIAD